MTHDETTDAIDVAVANWENDAIELTTDSTTQKLLESLLVTSDNLGASIDAVWDQVYLDLATGGHLGLHGDLANTPRKRNEGDDKYRERIRANNAAAGSGTPLEDLVQFASNVLGVDPENVELDWNYPAEPKKVYLNVPEGALDNTPLTQGEIATLTNKTVAAGGEVGVQTTGTFEFTGSGHTPSANSGFGEGSFGGLVQ